MVRHLVAAQPAHGHAAFLHVGQRFGSCLAFGLGKLRDAEIPDAVDHVEAQRPQLAGKPHQLAVIVRQRRLNERFVFQRGNHDDGTKKILGRSGRLDGDGFVSAILETPACSRYIARKLYRFFVADLPTGRPEVDKAAESVVRQLASMLVGAKYELKPVLKKLFASEHFYDASIQNELIKSPAELVVGAVRSFNTPVRDLGVLGDAMKLMGQQVFNPPSVKGWDGGRSWINTATLFIRQNILCFMLTGKTPQGYDPLANKESFDSDAFRDALLASGESAVDGEPGRSDTDRFIDELLRFTLGSPNRGNRKAVKDYLDRRARIDDEAVTHALLLVTAMPEYQLC